MNDMSQNTEQNLPKEPFLKWALSLGVTTTSIALALYGYLGIFSRYTSDDYCLSAFFLQENLINAMVERYLTSSNRYTNILFIGLSDTILGWYNVAILPALMLALFVLGLYLFLKEIGEMLQIKWSRLMVLFLSGLLVYLSITQAPDLYQTLYWRAGMTSHLAPIVFIPFLGAFLLKQIRNIREHHPSPWIQAAAFIIPFLIGGLSEPPTALLVTILFLAICAAWWWSPVQYRWSILTLLLWSFLGALTALIALGLAPANSLRLQTATPGLLELISRVILYPFYFMGEHIRTVPVPTLISIVIPFMLFYVQYGNLPESTSRGTHKRLGILMILVAVLVYFFIAAGFAPSAYGQSYPMPRVRFIGTLLLTIAFMTEGALIGALVAQARIQFFQAMFLRRLALITFIFFTLYPLRTAWRMMAEIPTYQHRAEVWDLRESEIRASRAQGIQDLVVPWLREDPIQDLGDQARFRLNRCAADLYGVNTIVARPMDKK